MKFGICGDPEERAQAAADAGFDFLENSVPKFLCPEEDDDTFKAALEKTRAMPLPTPVANGFIPNHLKITGPEVDKAALETYVTTALERARIALVDTVVFGSGGARRVPEGFCRQTAWDQLRDFCAMVAPIAAANDVTIVIEPLNLKECNIFNTVGECAEMVRAVDHPGIQLLVDAYHWGKDNDSVEDLIASGALIKHAHIATYENRRAPAAEPCDFSTFFKALAESGYNSRLSLEGNVKDPEAELGPALKLMQSLVAE